MFKILKIKHKFNAILLFLRNLDNTKTTRIQKNVIFYHFLKELIAINHKNCIERFFSSFIHKHIIFCLIVWHKNSITQSFHRKNKNIKYMVFCIFWRTSWWPSWIFVLLPGLRNLRNGFLETADIMLHNDMLVYGDTENCNKTLLSLGLFIFSTINSIMVP